jgi:hypothetical protein
MSSASPCSATSLRFPARRTAAPSDRRSVPPRRRLSPACGLEALDRLGIDIDQDPRAFAKFLELKNQDGQR